jgi:hypothetical protein
MRLTGVECRAPEDRLVQLNDEEVSDVPISSKAHAVRRLELSLTDLTLP